MQSIGVIRRIDDLGRIVIPKEIRKQFKIKENENLEIFAEEDKIIIKKHNLLDKNTKIINLYGKILKEITNKNIIITNRQHIIYCNKSITELFLNKEISEDVFMLINDRKKEQGDELEVIKNIKINNYICSPIIINSDSFGLIIMYSEELINDNDKMSIEIINKILNESLE